MQLFSGPFSNIFVLTACTSVVAVNEITNHKVAIKILNKRKIKLQGVFEKVKREIKVLRRFNHPHIIKHFEFIDTSSDIFIVLEYAEKGELFDLIQRKEKVNLFFSSKILVHLPQLYSHQSQVTSKGTNCLIFTDTNCLFVYIAC